MTFLVANVQARPLILVSSFHQLSPPFSTLSPIPRGLHWTGLIIEGEFGKSDILNTAWGQLGVKKRVQYIFFPYSKGIHFNEIPLVSPNETGMSA